MSSPSVNLAGKPSKLGGAVASVVGGVVLLVGLSIALGLGLLLYALVTVAVALAVALPIAIVVLVMGLVLVTGGRSLRRSGADTQRTTREHALLALAAHRGKVTAAEAATAVGVSVGEADAMLTVLAKREPERIAVDVDDQGVVWYRATSAAETFDARVRVAESVRVGNATSPNDAAETEVEEGSERAELRR
jgi:hypothetical protein